MANDSVPQNKKRFYHPGVDVDPADPRFPDAVDCPACGGAQTIKRESYIVQQAFVTHGALLMGTCSACDSTRTVRKILAE